MAATHHVSSHGKPQQHYTRYTPQQLYSMVHIITGL